MNAIKPELQNRHSKLKRHGVKFIGFESSGNSLEAMDGGYIYTDFDDNTKASARMRDDWDTATPNGFCDVVILSEAEYDILLSGEYSDPSDYSYFASDLFKATGKKTNSAHCNKVLLSQERLLSIDNGYPVSLELSYALGYAVAKHKSEGKYKDAEDAAINRLGNNQCDALTQEMIGDSLPSNKLAGILLLTSLVCILCTGYHYAKVRSERAKLKNI